jgi:hypothetical protein
MRLCAAVRSGLFGRSGNHRQQFDEADAFARRQWIEQSPFRSFRGEARRPQDALSSLRNHDRIGSSVFIGALAREKSALEHAAYHFRERRAVDPGCFDERRLTDAVVLLKREENKVLLFGQMLVARLAREKISIKLVASPHEMRRRFGKLDASVCLPLSLRHCVPPKTDAHGFLLRTTRETPGRAFEDAAACAGERKV